MVTQQMDNTQVHRQQQQAYQAQQQVYQAQAQQGMYQTQPQGGVIHELEGQDNEVMNLRGGGIDDDDSEEGSFGGKYDWATITH